MLSKAGELSGITPNALASASAKARRVVLFGSGCSAGTSKGSCLWLINGCIVISITSLWLFYTSGISKVT